MQNFRDNLHQLCYIFRKKKNKTLICVLVIINSSCSPTTPTIPTLTSCPSPPPSLRHCQANKVNKTCTPNFQRFMYSWKYDAPRIRILVRTVLSFKIFYNCTTNHQWFCVPVRQSSLKLNHLKWTFYVLRDEVPFGIEKWMSELLSNGEL